MTTKESYKCSECGFESAKWQGKCAKCQAWGTMQPIVASANPKKAALAVGVKSSASHSTPTVKARSISDIKATKFERIPTKLGEFDRVLGGGLVVGGVVLMAGDPGTGKSTVLGLVAHHVAMQGKTCLYISGEETAEQIALRMERIGAVNDNIKIAFESDVSKVLGHIYDEKPDFIVVDSIQTIASPELDGRVGERAQVTEVATILTRTAKDMSIPLVLVGHVTKDGTIAGPRTVEHLVDVVLYFEGDRDSPLRILRGIKNRYGASEEVGCFMHTEDGFIEVPDPSGLLLGRRGEPVAGVATSVTIEGRRPLPIEIQALVAPSVLPNPRRVISGIDTARGNQLQAVTERHGRVMLSNKDLYIATIGGVRTRETAVDLATILAIVSAQKDIPTPQHQVAIGEVTLSGEIRNVPGLGRRIAEAYRLGFTSAIVPRGAREEATSVVKSGINIIEVGNVGELVAVVDALA